MFHSAPFTFGTLKGNPKPFMERNRHEVDLGPPKSTLTFISTNVTFGTKKGTFEVLPQGVC